MEISYREHHGTEFLLSPRGGGRRIRFGYRYGDIVLPKLGKAKRDFKLLRIRTAKNPTRRSAGVSLGPSITGAACPHPDMNHVPTIFAGLCKRAASTHPMPDQQTMLDFEKFVQEFVEKHFEPLPSDSDDCVEVWLAGTSYPEWRKEELRKVFAEITDRNDPRWTIVKCFVKDEVYPDYKHARNIFSRTDEYKTMVGPYFKLIENEVYKHPAFIKHVPVADRPAYIRNMMFAAGRLYYATDYTAFESQFRKDLMERCEFILYKHMVKHLPNGPRFLKEIEALKKPSKGIFRDIDVELPVCRMSGEMNTSLGNGFSNLMFLLYTVHSKGGRDVLCVVEGDDGLATWEGPAVTSEDFAKLGLTIKMEVHETLNTASFCGLIFDPEEGFNVCDPAVVLAEFGWGDKKYTGAKDSVLKRLLRCKSLSLAHQYPGCPIIQSLARYGLRTTRGCNVGKLTEGMSYWYREIAEAAIRDEKKLTFPPPGPRTRALVEEKFGISVQMQLDIERYLDNKNDLGELSHPMIDFIMPTQWNHYSENFTCVEDRKDYLFEYHNTNEADLIREIQSLSQMKCTGP